MLGYILRRLLQAVPTLWGVFTVTFILLYIVPGDPIRLMGGQRPDVATQEQIKKELGLDKPLWKQYLLFLKKITTRLDFGRSFVTNRPVLKTILERFPATALLGITSLMLAALFGILLGTLAAVRQNSALDNSIRILSLLFVCVPSFFLAILLQWFFGMKTQLLPIAGYLSGPYGWKHLILPMLVMAVGPMSGILRLTRTSLLEVLGQDYIRTARAKGVGEAVVVLHHALRNAMIPVAATLSGSLAAVLSGAFFVEFVFSWPGIGLLAVDAINAKDFPMVQGTVLFSAVLFVFANLLSDISYALLDPRVRFE